QVVVQVVAAHGDGSGGDSEVADVSVHLLRPVTDVGAHGGPEVGVGQPVLQVRLVLGDVTRLLTDPHDEGCSAGGMPSVTLLLGAGRPTGRELRSEPEPVSRGVEDSPERAAARLSSTLAMRLRDELPP